MLRLLCVNSKSVIHENGICSIGHGLVEGQIYSAENRIYIHPNNKKHCYFIRELGDLKLITRFVRLSDTDNVEKDNKEEREAVLTIAV